MKILLNQVQTHQSGTNMSLFPTDVFEPNSEVFLYDVNTFESGLDTYYDTNVFVPGCALTNILLCQHNGHVALRLHYALSVCTECMGHLPRPKVVSPPCHWPGGLREAVCGVPSLTRRHGRPHDKEHPHRDPLQGGGQKAAALQDGVHHFVLQGN